jgi:hypothetical protein
MSDLRNILGVSMADELDTNIMELRRDGRFKMANNLEFWKMKFAEHMQAAMGRIAELERTLAEMPPAQCWHKEIDDETGICKSCGAKAAIKLEWAATEETPPLTDEEVANAIHAETSSVYWLNESGIIALTDRLNKMLEDKRPERTPAATEETPLPVKQSESPTMTAGASDRFYGKPCSACGDGDVEMKYHTHPPTPMRAERALPAQWENIADAKPSSFEFTTRDDAFRYCAQQLRNALAGNESTPTVCPEETPLVGAEQDFVLPEINATALSAGIASPRWNALEKQLAKALLAARREPGPGASSTNLESVRAWFKADFGDMWDESDDEKLNALAAGPGDRAMGGARDVTPSAGDRVSATAAFDRGAEKKGGAT